MRLVYHPDGQSEPREWPIDLGKFRTLEVENIERLTGLDYGADFKKRLLQGSALARRALLYTLQRREHPHLRFSDVDFADDEVRLEFDLAELREMRAAAAGAPMAEDQRSLVLSEIDRQIELETAAHGEASDEGKAL